MKRTRVSRNNESTKCPHKQRDKKAKTRLDYDYFIGGAFCLGDKNQELPVCVDVFRLIYKLTVRQLCNLQSEIKSVSIKHDLYICVAFFLIFSKLSLEYFSTK